MKLSVTTRMNRLITDFWMLTRLLKDLTGLKGEDIIGKTVLEVLPNTESHWIESYGQVALTGEPIAFENYSQDLDRFFHVTAFRPAKNQFACVFVDVTDYRRAEEALRDNEEKFRGLFENINVGVALHEIITDKDNKPIDFVFLNANPAYEELTQLKIEDIKGRRGREVIPNLEEKWIDIYGEVAQTGKSVAIIDHSDYLDKYLDVKAYSPKKNQFAVALTDITERKQVELEREATISILKILNAETDLHGLMGNVLGFLHKLAGCEAVGIRLRDGDDFPYYETSGFSEAFVRSEMHLCVTDLNGQLKRDEVGNPVLECMCGNIICGRFDPSKPFFTDYGSFISNGTTELLASTTEKDRQARTRNRCNGEGYESVFLVPLRAGGETFGLLQFNDRRKGCFSPQLVAQAERLAGNVGIAFAQRKAEEALKESKMFLDNMSDIAYMADDQGNVTWVNAAIERITGLSAEEIMGKPFLPLFIESDHASLMDVYKRTLLGESLENTLTFTSGVTCHFTSLPKRNDRGEIIGTFGVARDITESLIAEKRFRSARSV